MKRIVLLFISSLLCLFTVKAQISFKCDLIDEGFDSGEIPVLTNGACQPLSGSAWSHYKNMNLYIPDMDSLQPFHVQPIKTIRLNVNVIQNSDGTGNFINNEDFRSRLRTIIGYINYIYSHYSSSEPISWVQELPSYDSRIRFSIGDLENERVYFYRDSTWWNMHQYSLVQAYLAEYYPERLENINIYIFGNSNPIYNYASANPCNWVNISDNQHIVARYWISDADWAISMLLAHELAHSLGLIHTYPGGNASAICDQADPEFLRDVFLVSLPDSSNCPHTCDPNADPYDFMGDRITNNIVGGSKKELYISPMQAGQMHRATSLTSARKYVSCEKSDVPLVITDEQLWAFDIKLYRDLIVENGATLTLTCHLVMHPDARIIVKPGGKLIVDGATIGTDLFEHRLWQGIEVWGNRDENQFLDNGVYHQGYLELKNGATIENALCAVELWRPDYRAYTGGIIHASNAVFRNNAKAIRAMYYSNIDPISNLEVDYNGYFQQCSFIINQDISSPAIFNNHVEMNSVKGISFRGCSFSVDRDLSGIHSDCCGISAYNAGFLVTYLPPGARDENAPNPNYISSVFSGFQTGINSVNTGSNVNTFTVLRSVFDRNDVGISVKNNGYACVLNNTFRVGGKADCSYGIYAAGVSQFCIENNYFTPVQNTTCTTYGTAIRATNTNNDVFLNSFEGLSCANIAIGQNNDGNISEVSRLTGLTYTCNDNEDNEIDFCVVGEGNIVSGISKNQGSLISPAANTFSGSQYHFYNAGDYLIDYYYYNSQGQVPNSSKLYRVNTFASNSLNDCSPHYSDEGMMRSREIVEELEERYWEAYQTYEDLLGQYLIRLDGGDTEALVSMIAESTPDDRDQLKVLLLELSPYLSEEVLMTVARCEKVFDGQSVFEICAANPDVLKGEPIFRVLEDREVPLSPDWIVQLRQMAYCCTERTELLGQISHFAHHYSLAAGDIVRLLLNDSLSNPTMLRQWLDNVHELSSDRLLIASFVQEGDFKNAMALAKLLPERYNFKAGEWTDHIDYLRLLDLYRVLYESGRIITEMTDSEIEMVRGIADQGIGFSRSMAEAILIVAFGERKVRDACSELPENEADRAMSQSLGISLYEAGTFNVEVVPNPTTGLARVEYVMPNNNKERIQFYLTNAVGLRVLETVLEGTCGQKILDFRNLPAGVYIYSAQCGAGLRTGKIVITK